MDINQSSLSRYKTSKPGISRTVSDTKAVSDEFKSRENTEDSLKQPSFKDGQMIKAQIIDHRYNEVTIRIEPGNQVVKAKLSGDVPLSIGQEATFQVSSGQGDSLVLKYLPSDTAAVDTMIQKALTASGFPLSDKNRALVQELLNHNMPIDKQTLQTFIKLSHMNREASPLTLVVMYKNNIPITSENVRQFEAYQNGTSKILNDISAITKNLSELFLNNEEISSNILPDKVTLQPTDTFASNQNNANTSLQNNTSLSSFSQPTTLNTLQQAVDRLIQINSGLIDILYSEDAKRADTYMKSEGIIPNVNGMKTIAEGLSSINMPVETMSQDATNLNGTPSLSIPLNNTPTALADIINPSERAVLLERMNFLPVSNDMKAELEDGSLPLQKLLHFIQDNLPDGDRSAMPLLQAPEYTRLLERAFLDRWTVKPEEISTKTPVQELYQNLNNDIEKLGHLMRTMKEDEVSQQFREPFKNLQENVSFIKDLNEVFNYIQLPVMLKDKQLQSELYVYTRKKSHQEKQDSLSVLLHLDMDNLGSLNIHVQMQHNQIQAKFQTETAEVEQLLGNNLPLLENALRKKGYQFRAEIDHMYKEPDFIKDFIEQDSSDNIAKRYTFDIRT